MFPKVPQSSQTESLGFPSYPLPLDPFLPTGIEQQDSVPEGWIHITGNLGVSCLEIMGDEG